MTSHSMPYKHYECRRSRFSRLNKENFLSRNLQICVIWLWSDIFLSGNRSKLIIHIKSYITFSKRIWKTSFELLNPHSRMRAIQCSSQNYLYTKRRIHNALLLTYRRPTPTKYAFYVTVYHLIRLLITLK